MVLTVPFTAASSADAVLEVSDADIVHHVGLTTVPEIRKIHVRPWRPCVVTTTVTLIVSRLTITKLAC